MFAGNRDGGGTAFAATGMGLKSDALTPVQKESLKSILISYKCKMSEIHDFYLNNQNSITKDLKADFYQQGYSLSFILQKYHEKDPSLLLEDYIQEAERIRDHQLYKTKQSQKKFNIMPKLTKEKYEQYIEYEKDTRFPQARKPIALNSGARMPESSSLTKSQLNQKPGFNGFGNATNNNNNTNQFANNSNGVQQIGQNYNRPGSFQNGDALPNGAPSNQQPNVGFSARFNSNNGQNSTNDYNNGQQQSNNYPNSNGYNKPRNSQEEGGYGQNNSYRAGNSYNNNMGFARNRYQNNNRYNSRGRDPIEEEEDEKNNQGAGGFKTAQEQKYQNQYLKRQKEDGFYNKESGRYGRNNGQLDLEGVNDYKPKQYGGYNNRYNSNNKNETGVDDVVSLVHSHALGKKINLNNNESSSNTTAALNGGGTEDEKKAGLNKKFKPPGAPGTNPPAGKKNDPNDQLKGMDQKLVDMIESEIVQNAADVKWDDIAGLNSAKRSVHETIVWPMLNPLLFTGIRAPPKGLLLFGPPGTGKTMIGKAIACESGSTFFSISASSLTSKYIGEGEKMVKILFKLALQRQPSVIFIDEIDSLLCARQENENEASRRIKTEFLVQMEGTTSKGDERILLIGATNRPSELDDAVRRRFVKKLYIPLPNKEAREQLIRRVIDRESAEGNAFDLNPEEISEVVVATKGYSGADMSNLCREAALIPIRQCTDIQKIQSRSDIRPINKTDFMQSLRQVKATVTKKDLNGYYEWNQEFGSFDLNMEEIDS